MATITFPKSRVKEFYKQRPYPSHLRLGQDFYKFFELHKVVNAEDKLLCDKLYNAATSEANKLIIAHTDWEN